MVATHLSFGVETRGVRKNQEIRYDYLLAALEVIVDVATSECAPDCSLGATPACTCGTTEAQRILEALRTSEDGYVKSAIESFNKRSERKKI